ncbi:MAG: RNA polymerase factor sigma-32 [Gammaproteobacteria bacterium]
MNAVANFSFPSAADGYSAYARAVESLPPLDENEERALAGDYRQKNDLAAARRLALANLRLVVAIARGYNGYGLEQGDLVQEGNIGLLKAVQKFDPERGARLATFATYWIRAEIHNFILRNWRIIKIATTKAQRKLFFNMRRLFEKGADGYLRRAEDVARDLDVRPEDVSGMRARVQNTNCVPLSAEKDGESSGAELFLQADENISDPEKILIAQKNGGDTKDKLARALGALDARAREIVQARLMRETPETLHALAARFKISAERVRQLEAQALKKLRALLSPA